LASFRRKVGVIPPRMRFLTDEEYESYWDELGGTREAVAQDLT
jgi:hypothetical protein